MGENGRRRHASGDKMRGRKSAARGEHVEMSGCGRIATYDCGPRFTDLVVLRNKRNIKIDQKKARKSSWFSGGRIGKTADGAKPVTGFRFWSGTVGDS